MRSGTLLSQFLRVFLPTFILLFIVNNIHPVLRIFELKTTSESHDLNMQLARFYNGFNQLCT